MAEKGGRRASDDGSSATADTAEPAKPKRRRWLVIGCVVTVCLIAAGVGLFLTGMVPRSYRPKTQLSLAHPMATYIETPEMVTNLDVGPHRMSFVKFQCKIEVAKAGDQAAVTAAMPRIVDMLQTYVREMRPEELRSDVGMYRLHESLLGRAIVAVPDASVTDVLFEELIVQ